MSDESGVWESLIGIPDGIEHSHAVGETPEGAVELALRRAAEKYGPQDWARWRMRAELCSQPVQLRTVVFRWTEGKLVRL